MKIRSKEWQGRKFGQPEIKKKGLRVFSRREQLLKRLASLKKKPCTLHKTKSKDDARTAHESAKSEGRKQNNLSISLLPRFLCVRKTKENKTNKYNKTK